MLSDDTRRVLTEEFVSRRDDLVRQQQELAERRSQLLARERQVARELADCRAAARAIGAPD